MVCANPDIVVERGDRLVYCGGALARLYGELGGEAILVGKPHAPIYDGARSAARGARRRAARSPSATACRPTSAAPSTTALPALFVTGGIHAADFGPPVQPDGERVAARLRGGGARRRRLYSDACAGTARARAHERRSEVARASRRLETLPAAWRGGVVAIGNFDGVHLGHQAVLRAARVEAERLGVPCLMLTFEPHPRAFFSGRPIFRLTPAPLKAALAAALGLDGTLVVPFDRALAETSAEDFVAGMLVERLAIRAAVTGYDFHFGKARRGTPRFLAEEGRRRGFSVAIVDALRDGADAVSATRVRASLSEGDVTAANELLGWSFAVSGEVVARRRARPRARLSDSEHGARSGKRARARHLRGPVPRAPTASLRDGVASYGRRPTFGGGEPVLETFVFDFSGNLYGETALVCLPRLHPRARSASTASRRWSRRWISDSIDARAILERMPPGDLDRPPLRGLERLAARRQGRVAPPAHPSSEAPGSRRRQLPRRSSPSV